MWYRYFYRTWNASNAFYWAYRALRYAYKHQPGVRARAIVMANPLTDAELHHWMANGPASGRERRESRLALPRQNNPPAGSRRQDGEEEIF